jgi:hypothetical protein
MVLLTILHAMLVGLLVQPAPADHPTAADLLKQITGIWRAPEDRTPRTSDLDEKVFGAGASNVRNVTLTIEPSGRGKLSVSTAVVGRDGRRYAPSVVEANFTIADPVSSTFGRLSPTIAVVDAEERYLDGGRERWPIDGARVSITVIDPASGELEFRFDTKDGRGSFGTALKRRRQS